MAFPNSEFKDCLVVKTKADIAEIYLSREEEFVKRAEETISAQDYDSAYGMLSKIKDETKKEEYRERRQRFLVYLIYFSLGKLVFWIGS